VNDVRLADRTQRKAEGDARAEPATLEYVSAAVDVEHVTAGELYSRSGRETFGETDHAHVICVLLQE